MKQSITIAIIQPHLHWENNDANLRMFEEQMNSFPEVPDLVVLPETFSTGFTMNVKQFADNRGVVLVWMVSVSERFNIHITGSCIVKEGTNFYNRLYWVTPSGDVSFYDKRHLFRMGREQEHFTRGDERVIVKLGSIRFLLQICYDLRFPVFARSRGDYDVILYVANWPAARKNVWETLLIARAIENQSYVIGANCVGTDGEGIDNCGGSCVIDPRGKTKSRLNDQPGILFTTIDLEEIISFRKEFPAWEDADDFILT